MSFIPGNTGSPATFPDGFIGSAIANNETLATTRTLTTSDRRNQILTASGATRSVLMPVSLVIQGDTWIIMCPVASAFGLEIRGSDNTLIKSIGPGDTITLYAKSSAPVGASAWQTVSAISQTSVSAVNAIALASQSSATGWLTTNATAVTYQGVLNPLNGITPSAIQMDSSTAGGFNKYRFSLPDGLKNRPLNIDFHAKTTVAGDYRVEIYTNTAADYSGSFTKVVLSSDNSSGNSDLPAGNSNFRTFFVAQTADYYELRIVRVAASAATAYVTQVSLGMLGLLGNGAAVTDWVSYTPTESAKGTATYVGNYFWRRSGNQIEICANLLTSAVGSAAGTYRFSLPAGLTFDASPNLTGQWGLRISPTASYLALFNISSTEFAVYTSVSSAGTDLLFPSTSSPQVMIYARANIANWSSNVQMADRAVESYASNSSTSVVTESTSFAYGSAGSAFPSGAAAASFLKRVRFPQPVQATDTIEVEIQKGSGPWMKIAQAGYQEGVYALTYQNTASYGISIAGNSTSVSTDVDIAFGQYATPNGTTYGAAGLNWNGAPITAYKWRVRVVSSGAQIGGAIASSNIVSDQQGIAIPTGYLGELIEVTKVFNTTGSTTLGTYTDVGHATFTLTPGVWEIEAGGVFINDGCAGTGSSGSQLAITDSSNVIIRSIIGGPGNTSVPTTVTALYVKVRVIVTANTVYKMRFSAFSNSGIPTITGCLAAGTAAYPLYLRAVRVRQPNPAINVGLLNSLRSFYVLHPSFKRCPRPSSGKLQR